MVDSHKRIAGAFLVGAILVAGAFVMSTQTKAEQTFTNTGVAAVSAPERTHINISDSNKDGVPDWRDALQETDPILIGSSTTYVAPTTVTGAFALDFFKNYMRSKAYGEFGDTTQELALESTQKLAKQAIDELFTKDDISVFDLNDATTLHSYGNHIASILLAHPNDGDSEAIILQDYMRYHQKERLADLDPIALAYTTMVKEMLEAPVPSNYVDQHLNLVNTLNAVREDVRGMQKVDDDALYTLMRMKRYEDDVLGLSNALKQLFSTLYLQDNIRWDKSEPPSQLMTFTE